MGNRLLTKKEIEAIYGRPGFFAKKVITVCDYIAGCEEMDAVITERTFGVKPLVNFEVYPQGLIISMMHKFKYYYLGVSIEDMGEIHIEPAKILGTEQKSVIGRAILGGVILGPLGALIGGVSGLKNNVIKGDDILTVILNNNGIENALIFDIKKGKLKEVFSFFKNNYPKHFKL